MSNEQEKIQTNCIEHYKNGPKEYKRSSLFMENRPELNGRVNRLLFSGNEQEFKEVLDELNKKFKDMFGKVGTK